MSSPNQNPRVGVALLILNKEGKVLVGERSGSHGSGTWAPPGGHLEFGESFEACAVRETLEETGLMIPAVRFITAVNDIMEPEGKHYVTIYMGCITKEANLQPQVMEPDKCKQWAWVTWDDICSWADNQKAALEDQEPDLPRLFLPILNLLNKYPVFNLAKVLQ